MCIRDRDNLCHPVSVIRDAEILAAEAFKAAHAFLMVGGTTSAVQAMILSCAKRGEKIILPRNMHRSVMGAMVLGGAIPVYVDPACDERLGIPLGMRVQDVEKAIREMCIRDSQIAVPVSELNRGIRFQPTAPTSSMALIKMLSSHHTP